MSQFFLLIRAEHLFATAPPPLARLNSPDTALTLMPFGSGWDVRRQPPPTGEICSDSTTFSSVEY